MQTHETKISMVAPSGTGKTMLMTAIYCSVIEKLSSNSKFKFKASGDTEKMIKAKKDELEEHSRSGWTSKNRCPGTTDNQEYSFTVEKGEEKDFSCRIKFFDNKGGVYDDGFVKALRQLTEDKTRADNTKGSIDSDTKQLCQKFIDSNVLLVPIESPFVMHWYETKDCPPLMEEHDASEKSLCLSNVNEIVKLWAKNKINKKERALLIFVPLKCETYFNDNDGDENDEKKNTSGEKKSSEKANDRSGKLMKAVEMAFIEGMKTWVNYEIINVEIRAVDTFGISELREIELDKETKSLKASYGLKKYNKNGSPRILGATGLLSEIIKFDLGPMRDSLRRKGFLKKLTSKKDKDEFCSGLVSAFLDTIIEKEEDKQFLSPRNKKY